MWRTAEREKVGMMTMVGDAYAAPLIEELNRNSYELSSLYAIGTGGAATNPKHVSALLEKLPQLTIINGYGSSETGNMGFGHNQRGSHRETFDLREGGTVVSDDMTRFVEPGEPEVGWVVRKGRIPLGYFDDADATRKTFPVVDGQRVVVSGDRASLEADGTLRLYGRDSLVVNTGGEKVFVEEVEAMLRARPGVADALVVGRESDRWGQEIVALVETHCGGDRRRRARCTPRAWRTSPGSRRPRSSSSSRRCAASATERPTTGGRKAKRRSGSTDMTAQPSHRLPGQCALRRNRTATDLDAQGARRLLQGSRLDVRARRPVRTPRRDGRAGRGQGDPDGQPRQAVGHRAQVRRVATRPVQPGDGWRQPAQADAVAARAQRRRQRPSGGVCRCGAELLG